MGSVPRGLNEIELALLPKTPYQSNINEPQSSLSSENPEAEEKTFTKEICCICYDEINQGEYVTILKCKHIHHCECIKDWLVKQKNCPICKKEVLVDDFHIGRNPQVKSFGAE